MPRFPDKPNELRNTKGLRSHRARRERQVREIPLLGPSLLWLLGTRATDRGLDGQPQLGWAEKAFGRRGPFTVHRPDPGRGRSGAAAHRHTQLTQPPTGARRPPLAPASRPSCLSGSGQHAHDDYCSVSMSPGSTYMEHACRKYTHTHSHSPTGLVSWQALG